jgi:serine/threonine protein kinase/tetratricopeptide (TPR) repeat protein
VQVGDVIAGRFELVSVAGRGGMGLVFRAHDRESGRVVALKTLAASEALEVQRFRREARVLRGLSHPGIVRYVADGSSETGAPWLAMEWVEGEDLKTRLRRGPLDIEETIELGIELCEALSTLHAMRVVHRDIKPGNVRLIENGTRRSMLLDFGLVRALEGSATDELHTDASLVLGTPGYLSPEHARGEPADERADLFSLGAVLYACVSGVPPFRGPTAVATLAKVVLEDPPPLRARRPECPRGLERMVAGLLEKEPARRPESAAEVARTLRVLLESRSLAPGLVSNIHVHSGGPSQQVPVAYEMETLIGRRFEAPAEVAAGESWQRDGGDTTDFSTSHARRAAIGATEQRVVCLLLGRGLDTARSAEGHDPASASRERATGLAGSPLVMLADGSFLGGLGSANGVERSREGGGHTFTPRDQAAYAARRALALRDSHPGVRIALAMGHATIAQLPFGDAVDRAAQLLLATDAGQIRVDPLAVALLASRFEIVQGCLTGERATDDQPTVLGRATPTVGRRLEAAILEATAREAFGDSVARVVLVTAQAGVGKSRLARDLVRSVGSKPLVLLGQGEAMSSGAPYVMLAPALRRAVGIRDPDPLEVRHAVLEAFLGAYPPDAPSSRTSLFLGELLGAPYRAELDPALRAARADPALMAEQIRSAVIALARGITAVRPLLVVLEDLHWGDQPSVRLVDTLLGALADAPVFVLALARPEVHQSFPGLFASRAPTEVRLDALTAKASAELARCALGPIEDARLEAVVRRAGGNPFYLEELVRAVAGGGGDELPETVLGTVQARLTGLAPEARRFLRAASVFGESARVSGIEMLLESNTHPFSTADWTSELLARELFVEEAPHVDGSRVLRFRHALVRDAAYAMLTEADRVLAHARAGEWLEQQGGAAAALLARHHERGERPDRAVRALVPAAEQALEGSDLDGALAHVEHALSLGADGEYRGALAAVGATAAYWKNSFTDAVRHGETALESLEVGEPRWFAAAGSTLVSLARLGEYVRFDALFEQVRVATARGDGALGEQVTALARGTFQLVFAGRFKEADRTLDRITELSDRPRTLDARARAQAHHVRGVRAAMIGDVGVFLTHLTSALDAFVEAGDWRNVSLEATTVGWCWAELGQTERAIETITENLTRAERARAPQAVTYAKVNLGYALSLDPTRAEDARRLLETAVAECAGVRNARLEGWARTHLAALALAQACPVEAEEQAALAVERLSAAPGLRAWASATHARALVRLGRPDAAILLADGAMQTLTELGGLLQGESIPPLARVEALTALGLGTQAEDAGGDAIERLRARAERLPEPGWRQTFLARADSRATLAFARGAALSGGKSSAGC